MISFIIACGIGGCWSGYTHAKLIQAENEPEAEEKAFEFAWCELGETGRGFSYESFSINGDDPYGNANRICGGRLKQSAVTMLEVEVKRG